MRPLLLLPPLATRSQLTLTSGLSLTSGIAALTALSIALSLIMAGAWLLVRRTGNAGWTDACWSFGTGIVCALAALWPLAGTDSGWLHPSSTQGLAWSAWTERRIVLAGLVACWGVRLGLHIAARTWSGGEDARYADLRRQWGADFPRRLFWFLQIQAIAAIPLVLTVLIAAHAPASSWRGRDRLAIAVLIVALVGASVADWQLRRCGRDPRMRGRVCDAGLWRWSRHPNYFFEWLGWLAYPIVAIDLSGAYTWGCLTLAAPLLMYWLLVRVSGIPPLEAHLLRSRGDAYRDYQARVNAFFPGPRKRLATDSGRRGSTRR